MYMFNAKSMCFIMCLWHADVLFSLYLHYKSKEPQKDPVTLSVNVLMCQILRNRESTGLTNVIPVMRQILVTCDVKAQMNSNVTKL